MKRPDLHSFLTVISHLRSANVAPMQALVGEATWLVGEGEAEAYRAAGAAHVVETGKLCPSRNAGLRLAWDAGMPALQLSDDLRKVQQARVVGGKKVGVDIPFAEGVAMLRDAQKQTGAKLAGAAPTANAFYWNPSRPLHGSAFIVGDLIRVTPCDLLFDERMTLKEDYDYTLQHVVKHGCVARVNGLLPHFLHRTNSGGAVADRTPALEQENIAFLKDKWGAVIQDNPRRPDEILLKIPRRR